MACSKIFIGACRVSCFAGSQSHSMMTLRLSGSAARWTASCSLACGNRSESLVMPADQRELLVDEQVMGEADAPHAGPWVAW